MKILFVAGFGPIIRDQEASPAFYEGALGIPFEREEDGYLHTDKVPGVKAFALWPLSQAAESTFGSETWPENVPVPQAWLEFDVDDVDAATAELKARGYEVLVASRKETWGQTVTRLLSPEGILVGVTVTPWMREGAAS
jgi:catechol 2,3-dioxygenase-like lactoylglutathione lyase family enzyme